MIEAKIEKIIIDEMSNVLADQDVDIWGTWTPSEMKGEEDESTAFLTIKVYPRSYETPTIPDAQIEVEVSLIVRSDVDYNGETYLDLTDKISEVFQAWQNCFEISNTKLSIGNEFEETGFSLGGGDCGIDKEKNIWQFTQTMTIYGIIQ